MRLECDACPCSLDAFPCNSPAEHLASGAVTPRAAAEEALARANSNGSHTVYIALMQRECARKRTRCRSNSAAVPCRFSMACRFRLKIASTLPDSRRLSGSRLRGWQRRGARRFRGSGPPALAGRDHHRQNAHASAGLWHHRRKSGLRRLRAAARRAASHRRLFQRRCASVQEQSALAAIGTDTGGSVRVP